MKKNPEHPFVDIIDKETCAKFQQKILKSVVAGFFNLFNFSNKLTGFSELIKLCLNLGIGFFITWLVLSNYERISP